MCGLHQTFVEISVRVRLQGGERRNGVARFGEGEAERSACGTGRPGLERRREGSLARKGAARALIEAAGQGPAEAFEIVERGRSLAFEPPRKAAQLIVELLESYGIADGAGGAGRIGLLREPAQSRMQIIERLAVVALARLHPMHEAPKKVLDRVLIRQALVRGRLALPAEGARVPTCLRSHSVPLPHTPPEFASEWPRDFVPRD